MDLEDLTQRMHAFVRSKGWYGSTSVKPQTPKNLAVSLVLEANEVLELFQWSDELDSQDELASELADVMLYLIQLASVSKIDLEKAVLSKLDENYNRKW